MIKKIASDCTAVYQIGLLALAVRTESTSATYDSVFMPEQDVDNSVQIHYSMHIVGLPTEMFNHSGRLGTQSITYSKSRALGQSGEIIQSSLKASIMKTMCFLKSSGQF